MLQLADIHLQLDYAYGSDTKCKNKLFCCRAKDGTCVLGAEGGGGKEGRGVVRGGGARCTESLGQGPSSLRAYIRTETKIAETNGNYSENEKIEWNNGLFVGVKRRWPLGHLLRLHEREDT